MCVSAPVEGPFVSSRTSLVVPVPVKLNVDVYLKPPLALSLLRLLGLMSPCSRKEKLRQGGRAVEDGPEIAFLFFVS